MSSYRIDHTLIELAPIQRIDSPGQSISITRMKIIEVFGDYLTCRTQSSDGSIDDSENLIPVAKPTFLRVTGVHGTTRDGWSYNVISPANERTLTAVTAPGITPGLIVVEEVRPSYKANDTIYATQPDGETAVESPMIPGSKITWLDMNGDSRNWLHRRIMLDACVLVNNVPTQKRIVFSAGPIP